MRSFVLFSNKGGVGRTTLTFNIAHMAARLGLRTVVLDCDPQSDLSALFLGEERLVELWERAGSGRTVASCLEQLRCGKREVEHPDLLVVEEGLWLLPGHLSLSRFEQSLADEWPKASAGNDENALVVTTALDLLSNMAASAVAADLVLLDAEPSLGALNRSAFLACDALVFPLVPDYFNLLALKNVGPAVREWRRDWDVVRNRYLTTRSDQDLPDHRFQSIGYIVQQQTGRLGSPVQSSSSWAAQIPEIFHQYVLDEPGPSWQGRACDKDPQCLATLKNLASLLPIARLARKPLFDLKQADGIGRGQIQVVAECRSQFESLVREIARRLELSSAV